MVPDEGRRAHGRRHLPPQGHEQEIPDHLQPHALQLQLLGRKARHLSRHVHRARRRQARLRPRRDERARSLLLRRQLRHPRRAALRRRRPVQLDGRAAVVLRKGRPHRLLFHRRVAARRGIARQQGADDDHSAELRRRRRQGRPLQRAGQLVSRRRRADALHRLALRRTKSGAPHVPQRHLAGRSHQGVEDVRPRPADAARRLGQSLRSIFRRRTSSPPSTAPRASSPTRCRTPPAAP